MKTYKTNTILTTAILAMIPLVGACSVASSTQSGASGTDAELAAGAETSDAASFGETDISTAHDTEAATTENQESHFDPEDLEFDAAEVVEVTLDGTTATADTEDVAVDGSIVTISAEGIYSLSGTLTDGEVVVDAADEDDVMLILDGVDITNSDGAAIAVMNADDVVVLLADGSTNSLTDGADYTFPGAETDEPNATLYSAADLTVAGDGELIVSGNYNDGIASKDGLVIDSGIISVVAADDGIRGKDYAIIDGGTVTVLSLIHI